MTLKGRELFGLKLAVGGGERPLLRLISIIWRCHVHHDDFIAIVTQADGEVCWKHAR